MLTIVSLRLGVTGPHASKLSVAPIANQPFPITVEWESTTKSTYRIDAQGVIRCKRPKSEQSS